MEKTIEQMLLENPDFVKGIEQLISNKSKKKCFKKAGEESSELTTNILKYLNDKEKITDYDMLEEIVDNNMNMILIQRFFTTEEIQAMVNEKIGKFLNSKKNKKYFI